jgi:NTP pyrophosphatase (non-canonical NTP hydrolase)
MNIESIQKLLAVVDRKYRYDQKGTWSNGATTYLTALKEEVKEVEEELKQNRTCFIEDELGDILWDYLSALKCLEHEKGIDVSNVLKRALNKYDERITGIENGTPWNKIKDKQKAELKEEYKLSN